MKRSIADCFGLDHEGGTARLGSESAIAGLFGWWRRQLWPLLPRWIRNRPARRDAIIIQIGTFSHDPHATPATGQIVTRRARQEQAASPLDFSQSTPLERDAADAVILRLPRQMVLRREMMLPITAERDLPTLIHFQMPRLTPFDAKEVFWGISEPIRDQSRLKLTLHVVQRHLLRRLLDALAGIGLEPSVLEDDSGIELARFGHRNTPLRGARLGFCAILALACLSVPLVSQQIRLQATENRLETLVPVQRQIMELHAQIAERTASQRLIEQAQGSVAVLHTLAMLTAALPDGTWLNDLTVNGNNVTFDGQSSDAAHLISALTATAGLQNVSFSSPVTRAPGGPDAFSIQLSISR